MNLIPRLRWRLASWIAPSSIIAAPLGDGPAILVRSAEAPKVYGWVTPKSLEINIEQTLAMDRYGLGNVAGYQRSGHTGSITGTV